MTLVEKNGNTVRITTWQWVILVGMVAGIVVFFYQSLESLDHKWQVRTDGYVADLKCDIKEIRQSIPPDWFRSIVESHTSELRMMRQEVAEMRAKCDEFERHIIANTPK